MKHIAIIGSGPAGSYLADQLLRLMPDASIDVIEQLPVPFGLIRYGVAPDHQSTKAVARLFDRVLARDRVSFFGNVSVGRDVQLDDLIPLYDAIVLATGAQQDRRLGIPGEDLPGVMGSGDFVGWYNAHPHRQPPPVSGVQSAVVIGNGNVAIDVARILAKGPEELAGSDLPAEVSSWLASQPLQEVRIVGRRGAADAKFNDHELAELGTLRRARPVVLDPAPRSRTPREAGHPPVDDKPASLSGDNAVTKTLRTFVDAPPRDTPVSIVFHFNLTPFAFVGDDKLREVQFRSANGETVTLPAQLAITCIGYEALACGSLLPSNGLFANQDGKVDERLYVVGWAKRGPSGTIPTNRTEAQQVAQKIAQEITDGNRPGGVRLRELLDDRGVCWIDYAGWHRIDAAELAQASAERCRIKFRNTEDMLEAARSGELTPG
jgi:NADPH-dependent glutamate synthase beta subunit-like oxidoreductase